MKLTIFTALFGFVAYAAGKPQTVIIGSPTGAPLLAQPAAYRTALLPAQPALLPAPQYARSAEAGARILRLENDQNEVSYRYAYETENGIRAEESGHLDQNPYDPANPIQRTSGSYSYIGPDGQQYSVTYTADENGFQARGPHLPVGPAPPAYVTRQLQDLAARGLLKK